MKVGRHAENLPTLGLVLFSYKARPGSLSLTLPGRRKASKHRILNQYLLADSLILNSHAFIVFKKSGKGNQVTIFVFSLGYILFCTILSQYI